MTAALRVRPANALDLDFVMASWVDSYRMSHFAGPIPMPMYRDIMTACVRWILQRPGVEVVVAYKPGEHPPDDLYGWVCVESDVHMRVREFDAAQGITVEVDRPVPQKVVHFAYVKQFFREHGIATRLLIAVGVDPRRPIVHTFKTGISAKLQGLGKLPGAAFAPQLARFPKNEPKETR